MELQVQMALRETWVLREIQAFRACKEILVCKV
jgi:hypothetical protein